jgi:hypothetical protein
VRPNYWRDAIITTLKKFSRFVAFEIYKAFYKIENKIVETAFNIKNTTQL